MHSWRVLSKITYSDCTESDMLGVIRNNIQSIGPSVTKAEEYRQSHRIDAKHLPAKNNKSFRVIQFIHCLKDGSNGMIQAKTNQHLNTRSTCDKLFNQLACIADIGTDRLAYRTMRMK